MKNITKRFIADESGATAIEYGLVAALMGVAVIAIFGAFQTKLTSAFTKLGNSLDSKAAF